MVEIDPVLLSFLTPEERQRFDSLLLAKRQLWTPLPGPQTDAYMSRATIVGYGGAAGGGKASPVHSNVLTPKGWKPIGELRVGDLVSNPVTGGQTAVIGVYPQGVKKLYRVTCDDGAQIDVCAEHLWAFKRNGHYGRRPGTKAAKQRQFAVEYLGSEQPMDRWRTLWVGSTETLQEHLSREQEPRIPLAEPVVFTVNGRTGTMGCDPYFVGLYLGDGTHGGSICTADQEIADFLTGIGCSRYSTPNSKADSYGIVGPLRRLWRDWLNGHGLQGRRAWEKFVPPYALTAPIDYRLALLQGLMDSDGYVDCRGRCFFNSTSERLVEDVRELVRGLGGKASLRERKGMYSIDGERRPARLSYETRVWMRKTSALFRLSRKKARCRDSWNGGAELMRAVTKIEPVGEEESVCIQVDSPFGLYIGEDYIVTHNSDLGIGLALTSHQRVGIFRQNGTELTALIDRAAEIMGNRDGLSEQRGIWRLTRPDHHKVQMEFGSFPNPGDERKYQGRPHDLLMFDEAQNMRERAVRFLLGWLRTTDPEQRCRVLMTFNPPTYAVGQWVVSFFGPWLDRTHRNPAEPGELRYFTTLDGADVEVDGPEEFEHKGEQVKPQSRTFIPSRVSDNPYLQGTEYETQLQSLPEPLRSQMLHGDFIAGMEDDEMQVIPTAWVETAQNRWQRPETLKTMESVGVDVAMGGRDQTVIFRRHEGLWFDEPIVKPGRECIDGPTIAGFVIGILRDRAVIHVDLFGVGAQPYAHLMSQGLHVIGVNVGDPAGGTDQSGRLRFKNLRSQLWWHMREALDPTANNGIALPPDRRLLADLTAPRFRLVGQLLQVEGREDIIKRLGRSPDFGSSIILAMIDTPKRHLVEATAKRRRQYDPFATM